MKFNQFKYFRGYGNEIISMISLEMSPSIVDMNNFIYRMSDSIRRGAMIPPHLLTGATITKVSNNQWVMYP